ncbi:unnamed protein product [Nesidiocoris tenuis]|uniref:Uncharacterized protein n=1 Tax=Nesidiocoris tenuis TaxID=355587 RepID=A0A6H5HA76_9HEMI|nr:unnamed protein product [Nesidiocoris tenuis]
MEWPRCSRLSAELMATAGTPREQYLPKSSGPLFYMIAPAAVPTSSASLLKRYTAITLHHLSALHPPPVLPSRLSIRKRPARTSDIV